MLDHREKRIEYPEEEFTWELPEMKKASEIQNPIVLAKKTEFEKLTGKQLQLLLDNNICPHCKESREECYCEGEKEVVGMWGDMDCVASAEYTTTFNPIQKTGKKKKK